MTTRKNRVPWSKEHTLTLRKRLPPGTTLTTCEMAEGQRYVYERTPFFRAKWLKAKLLRHELPDEYERVPLGSPYPVLRIALTAVGPRGSTIQSLAEVDAGLLSIAPRRVDFVLAELQPHFEAIHDWRTAR